MRAVLKHKTLNYRSLFHVQKGNCWICGERMKQKTSRSPLSLTRDHLIPASRGGKNLPNNKLLAHQKCNVQRANNELTPEQWQRAHQILHAAVAYELAQ